jgi:hypothetical protein
MTHDDDTCPHLVRANLLEAENARLKDEVKQLASVSEAWKKRRLDKVEAECIKWDDLEKENARLKTEVERLKAMYRDTERWMLVDGEFEAAKVGTYAQLKAEVERLTLLQSETLAERNKAEAQVERLTEAGDDLAIWLGFEDPDSPRIAEWNAAKEGKQP